jgi:curved DNA-binding protein
MDYQDYYQTLGLPRTASQAEIKKAFRRLAREHHPDKKPGDSAAERRFKQVNEAHAVLSDPEKRKKYDVLGANWDAFSRADPGGAAAGRAGNPFADFARSRSGQSGNVRYEFRTSGGAGGDFSDFFRTFFTDEGGSPSSGSRGRSTGAGPSIDDILSQMGLDDAKYGGSLCL